MTQSTVQRFRTTTLFAIFVGLLLGFFGFASQALAHDQIIEQFPASEEHFESSPANIELTFNNVPLTIGTMIMVVDADGADWVQGEPTYQNTTVSQALTPDLADGYYQVRWRVVSSDGHPISESFYFSVGAITEDSARPSITPAESESTADATTEPGSEVSGPEGTGSENPDENSQPQDSIEAAEDTSGNPWRTAFFVLGGSILGVGLFSFGYFIAKNRAQKSTK